VRRRGQLRVCVLLAVALAAVALFATRTDASSLFDSIYRFHVTRTPHFVIYFHQGEDTLAARLALIAEETWRALERPFGARPPKLTHVVLVDQTELANGSATPVPRDTIVVTAAWPAASEFIGRTDDWLRLVFTHEFTHVVHLDRSESWARAVRAVFGRGPLAFPNLFLPVWQIEGLATYEESAITGEGRLHAGDFRAIVAEDARARGLEPLDRVNGGLTDWPAGLAPYAYGLGFHAYLAGEYGADKFGALAQATSRRIPYTASRVFKRIYGKSLGDLWSDYEKALEQSHAAPAPSDDARRLTRHGFVVTGPRFMPPSCDGCPLPLLYSVRTPHDFPALYSASLDGSSRRRLTRRYLGSTTTASDARTIYFDQQEFHRNTGLYSDLYALDATTGRVRQLTNEARLTDPDFSASQRALVAVRSGPGRRDLVRVPISPADRPAREITTIASEPETQFGAPRWSPDSRSIAAERHRLGAQSEIVVVDAATGAVHVVASGAETRWATPAWRPDGRALVAAAEGNEQSFNLYEIDLDTLQTHQLTHSTGGATWPDVSPDGRTIVYAGYTVDGFDVFAIPYARGAAENREPEPRRVLQQPESPRVPEPNPPRASAYAPWPTLPPTSWSPIVESDRNQTRVGAATGGADVLGYHAWAASATWRVAQPEDVPRVSAIAPDWELAYAYARWRPTFWLTASSDTSFFAGPPTDAGIPSINTLREREIEAGVILPVLRTRVSQSLQASIVRAVDEFTFPDHVSTQDRFGPRAAWSIASAHSYGYSISPEDGAIAGVTGELVRRAVGASEDASAATADARLYLPGFADHHVVAIRGAGGASTGDRDLRRAFLLGGAGPNVSVVDFGHEAISLLRGFPADTFAGTHVALVNADYRWPIARPQRGTGTWPIFLHTIHAAVFGDVGHAWTRAFAARDVKTSVGAELSVNLVAGYFLPLTATIGAAWGHDGSHTVEDRATVFFRVGRAF
jgi:Tol biopolymer transport system component